jgi:hypothetical protein
MPRPLMGITVEFTDGCTDALTAVATTMVLHTTKVREGSRRLLGL